jgi:hypothetical protein
MTVHACAIGIRRAWPRRGRAFAGAACLALLGCAQMPTGPSVAVMPGPNKPFDVFMQDDSLCRSWAAHSIGQPGNDVAARRMLGSTATGAVIGALAGAALGGDHGAGVGAAMGTVVGATSGADQSAWVAANAQRAYDIAYEQCMHSQGNLVPGGGYLPYGRLPPGVPPPPPAVLP